MKSFNIEVLNPKANSILEGLVKLKLIRIKDNESENKFTELLNKFLKNTKSLSSKDETHGLGKLTSEESQLKS